MELQFIVAEPGAPLSNTRGHKGRSILIEEYRSFRAKGGVKDEPIDADESKLIMKALADGDWKGQWNFSSLSPSPGHLFQRLGVTKADGFAPAPGGDYQ